MNKEEFELKSAQALDYMAKLFTKNPGERIAYTFLIGDYSEADAGKTSFIISGDMATISSTINKMCAKEPKFLLTILAAIMECGISNNHDWSIIKLMVENIMKKRGEKNVFINEPTTEEEMESNAVKLQAIQDSIGDGDPHSGMLAILIGKDKEGMYSTQFMKGHHLTLVSGIISAMNNNKGYSEVIGDAVINYCLKNPYYFKQFQLKLNDLEKDVIG